MTQEGSRRSKRMEILGYRGNIDTDPPRLKKRRRQEPPFSPAVVEMEAAPPSTTGADPADLFSNLPDECISLIFSFLPSPRDRFSCVAVSRKWLLLQADMRLRDFPSLSLSDVSNDDNTVGPKISLCWDSRASNDVRLASAAVRASSGQRALTDLFVRTDFLHPPARSSLLNVTDMGLKLVTHACSKLRVLTLSRCHMVGNEGLAAIASGCPDLEELYASHLPLVDDGGLVHVAESCPMLSVLSLVACPLVGDVSLHAFVRCSTKLESITLERCPLVSDAGLGAVFSCLSRLTKFVVAHMKVGDGVLEAVGARVRHVTVKSCGGFTDGVLVRLSVAASRLESLQLEKCHEITAGGVMGALRNLSGMLKSLFLVKCDGIGAAPREQQQLINRGHLQCLKITKCPGVGDEFLSLMGKAVAKAKTIAVVGTSSVTDRGFISLMASLDRRDALQSVDLSGCRGITDWSVAGLVTSSGRSLRRLALVGCEGVTDRSLRLIGQLCLGLVELDLTGCRWISDGGVAALLAHGDAVSAVAKGGGVKKSRLEVLSVEGCEGITDDSLGVLEKMVVEGRLVGLNLRRCGRLTRAGVDALRQTLWWCDVIS